MEKGVTNPRIFTPPLRKLTEKTSLGFACIGYAEIVLKKVLYPWQKFALIHSLEIVGSLEKEWRFRFRTVLFLISRQNGKTVLSEVIASFFINFLGVESVFGTSLSLDKAEEVWEAVVQDQETAPDLKRDIKRVSRTNGNKRLILSEGRQYKVGAPTRRAGRGDSNDLVMIDEIREHRDWETWSAAAASTTAKPNAVVFCFSNAGDPDSVVLRQLRSQAIAMIEGTASQDFGGEVDAASLGLFEWSAPDGAKTDDLEALAQANPSLGYGKLTMRALMSNRGTFPENKFRSECMCQQVETILPAPFPDGAWDGGVDTESFIAAESELFFGIDMSADRRWTSIGVCGRREDGNMHIEVIARRVGCDWAEEWFRTRAAKGPMNLCFQERGAPVSGLAEQLCTIPNINRVSIAGPDLSNGWGRFWDAIAVSAPEEHRGGLKIFHLPQPVMDAPAKTMQLRNLGGGVELPDRTKSPDDIAPLYCCVMAFIGATKTNKEKKIYQSAYASGSSLAFV